MGVNGAGRHLYGGELIRNSLKALDHWIEGNGWAGYDPYDILGLTFFIALCRSSSLPVKVLRRMIFALEDHFPVAARRAMGIGKAINAKGMGLLAKGYLNLFEATGERRFELKARECLQWLSENNSMSAKGMAWGYPFDWQSRVFIPAGTPSAVVTSVVGDAFLKAHQLLCNGKYLGVCARICEFITGGLNIDEMDGGRICFSYTPLDNFHVHNANLFAAEFLAKTGKALGRQDLVDLGCRAANYAVAEQNRDGSLYYWGRVQNHYSPNHIDHYHSGFEIRMLHGMWKATGDDVYRNAAGKYYSFYRKNLLLEDGTLIIPKMTPRRIYPVDIHSCAEALLCNATVSEDFPQAAEVLPGLASWILPRMQNVDGSFIYMISRHMGIERRSRIPFMRWGQAWMLLALSACRLIDDMKAEPPEDAE